MSSTTASLVAYETPPAPVISSVVTSGGRELTITWGAREEAAGYELYFSEEASGSWVFLADTGATSYTHKGLKNKRVYFYQVRAYSGPAQGHAVYFSEFSPAASGVSSCIPGDPEIGELHPGDGSDTVIFEDDMSCQGDYDLHRD